MFTGGPTGRVCDLLSAGVSLSPPVVLVFHLFSVSPSLVIWQSRRRHFTLGHQLFVYVGRRSLSLSLSLFPLPSIACHDDVKRAEDVFLYSWLIPSEPRVRFAVGSRPGAGCLVEAKMDRLDPSGQDHVILAAATAT